MVKKKREVIPPKINSDKLKHVRNLTLEDEDHYKRVALVKSDLSHRITNHLIFSEVTLTQIDFIATNFNRSEWCDVIFIKCDLSNTAFEQAIFHRVEFIDCKLSGVTFTASAFRHVTFNNCYAPLVIYGDCDFKYSAYLKSVLDESSFYNNKFSNVELIEININDVEIHQTSLSGIDLSKCSFEKLLVSADDLKGCIISPEQAVPFIQALGLKVKFNQ
ncbi:Uncharacterized protein YjbI, contains pentapeptide repeats [Shouchella lonarensis]|uniref:Uncharacterized protein YjbI, contains pentapeptide repeats n=1 Tax=Shouchella lonarensis TaxID=1464122 RepID=A0A1G6N0R5_9BACI|nr:Uncharacterized protein YjbI, contains pentapeptide repeats [Shouchella lonarensis]